MTSDKVKMSFVLDADGRPVDCLANTRNDANTLVEEVSVMSGLLLRARNGPIICE
jgi:exoribonuclease R